MSKTTKEEAYASLVRFVNENGRYPTKLDCRKTDWLFSQQTYQRVLGPRNKIGILEEWLALHPPSAVVEKCCAHCNTPLPKEKRYNKFCNHSCSAQYTNARRPPLEKRTLKTRKVVDTVYKLKDVKSCLSCGNILTKKQTLYCTLQCQADHRFKLSVEKWLSTGLAPSNPAIRKYITHLDGYKCECCGLSDWNGKPITLEVEHKDGNSEDDSRENVCLICPNCHSQTDTYKGKNRGNGRHWRAQRYREGKSY